MWEHTSGLQSIRAPQQADYCQCGARTLSVEFVWYVKCGSCLIKSLHIDRSESAQNGSVLGGVAYLP